VTSVVPEPPSALIMVVGVVVLAVYCRIMTLNSLQSSELST
jgi:hypothetical protein